VYDAIVVGSGAAGSFAAKELTERGLQVVLLEAGRPIDPVTDFPVPPKKDRGYASRVFRGLACQPIQTRLPDEDRRAVKRNSSEWHPVKPTGVLI
jgi:choline dehydrogenase-like flavoprotein